MPTALSCLPKRPEDGGASAAFLPEYIHVPKKEKENVSTSSMCGKCLNTEVKGETLTLYVYGSRTNLSALIAVLIITT